MDKWLPDTCAPDKFAGTFCCWGVILQASAGWGEGTCGDSDLGDAITSCYMRFLAPRN